MKKNTLNIVLSIISIVLIILITILFVLGKINRIGYLSDFKLISLSDEGYIYDFRIKYYSKIFRNSDIYGVYPDLEKFKSDNDFIKEISIPEWGSPFGSLISSSKIDTNKIYDINYKLSIKLIIFLIFIVLILFFLIIILRNFCLIKINKLLICFIILFIQIFVFILLNILGHRTYNGHLVEFQLFSKSDSTYVYKAQLVSKGIFSKNLIYNYSNDPIIIEKNNNIKNYGYNLTFNKLPDNIVGHVSNQQIIGSNYSDTGFFVSNVYQLAFYYKYHLYPSQGEVYNTEICARKISGDSNEYIIYRLDHANSKGYISNINVSTNYILYTNTLKIDIDGDRAVYNNPIGIDNTRGALNVKYWHIKQVSDNLYVKNNDYVIITYNKPLPANYKILNVEYKLSLKPEVYAVSILLLLIYIIILCKSFYSKLNNIITDKIYIGIIILVGLLLAIFHFWLGFPGNLRGDTLSIFFESISGSFSNANPIIIPNILKLLYSIFGYHTFYLFFINIFFWYAGLTILIVSIYHRFKNKYIIFLFLISFIGNIFFTNIVSYKDYMSSRIIWFSLSLISFKLLVNIKNRYVNILLNIFIVLTLILSMLFRHNAIVTVYPIFILISYIITKYLYYKKNIKNIGKNILIFMSSMIFFAILLLAIYKINPHIYPNKINIKEIKFYATHIYNFQISAIAVMANDNMLIPKKFYKDGQDFEYLKNFYYDKREVNADYYGYVFNADSEEIKKLWIKSITKHPFIFIKQASKFAKAYLANKPGFVFNVYETQMYPTDYYLILAEKNMYIFPKNEQRMSLSNIQIDIYDYLFKNTLYLNNHFVFYSVIILFIFTIFIFLFKNKYISDILIYLFSLLSSCIATFIVICLFVPLASPRYFEIIIPIMIMGLIIFFVYIFDSKMIKIYKKDE